MTKMFHRELKMVEVNFLCVHKKLRSKRVAPVLIKEITRRVHQQGISQAVYSTSAVLPKPIATCRYDGNCQDISLTLPDHRRCFICGIV